MPNASILLLLEHSRVAAVHSKHGSVSDYTRLHQGIVRVYSARLYWAGAPHNLAGSNGLLIDLKRNLAMRVLALALA